MNKDPNKAKRTLLERYCSLRKDARLNLETLTNDNKGEVLNTDTILRARIAEVELLWERLGHSVNELESRLTRWAGGFGGAFDGLRIGQQDVWKVETRKYLLDIGWLKWRKNVYSYSYLEAEAHMAELNEAENTEARMYLAKPRSSC